MSSAPQTSDGPIGSRSDIVESRIPSGGVASSATETVLAVNRRPTQSTNALLGPRAGPLGRRRDSSRERVGFERLANSEHEPSNLDSAQHVAVEHPAIAAEHFPLGDASAPLQSRSHSIGEVWIMRHVIPLPAVGRQSRDRSRLDRPTQPAAKQLRTGES
jgi:hypothetical protein